MKYHVDGAQVIRQGQINGWAVVQTLESTGETHIAATCFNEAWAKHIVDLLNDYELAVKQQNTNTAGTTMVRIEGNDLETLRMMLSGKATGRKTYLLRVDQRSDTVAFKVNEGTWTHGMGKPQPPY